MAQRTKGAFHPAPSLAAVRRRASVRVTREKIPGFRRAFYSGPRKGADALPICRTERASPPAAPPAAAAGNADSSGRSQLLSLPAAAAARLAPGARRALPSTANESCMQRIIGRKGAERKACWVVRSGTPHGSAPKKKQQQKKMVGGISRGGCVQGTHRVC